MNARISKGEFGFGRLGLRLFLILGACFVFGASNVQAAKCTAILNFPFDPESPVTAGNDVLLTLEAKVASGDACGVAIGNNVTAGNLGILQVTLNGEPRPCAFDIGKYCTAGDPLKIDTLCQNQNDCGESAPGLNDGKCDQTHRTSIATENTTTDGVLTNLFSTSGLGGSTVGLWGTYQGTGNYSGSPEVCKDLVVEEEDDDPCGDGDGALITISEASGPNPVTPGNAIPWTFTVRVHACEDLAHVTAQGGTNGWAPLATRDDDPLDSVDPNDNVLIKTNKKNEVILWTIGPMGSGDDAFLTVTLFGTIKANSQDCKDLFLSGPWSTTFSTDGIVFEKSDYTGRVILYTDTNADPDDCGP